MEIEWTYCVDRMPEQPGRYLISVDNSYARWTNAAFWQDGIQKWDYPYQKPVYAWAPLPPPAPLPEEVAHDGD
jgi:hypothetical protein